MKHASLISLFAAAICACGLSSCNFLDSLNTGNEKGKTDNPATVETDWSDPAWYSTNFWDRTDRERAGLRGPVKKWHISNYTTYDEYEYDREGHLVADRYVQLDADDLGHEWYYTYDANGHRIKAECSIASPEEGFQDTYEYEYANTGKYVATTWFMLGPEISDAESGIQKDLSRSLRVYKQPLTTYYWENTFTFNEAGNLVIKETSYSISAGSEEREGETTIEYTVVYENGYPKSLDSDKLSFNVINITYYPNGMYKDFVYKQVNSYNSDTGWDTHTYRMLENPRYLAIESFDLGGTASYMTLTPKWMRRSYDAHFDIVKNEESYGEGAYTEGAEPTFTDTWTEYTYDKYGNWVTRVEHVVARYTGQEGDTTIQREMEYFD